MSGSITSLAGCQSDGGIDHLPCEGAVQKFHALIGQQFVVIGAPSFESRLGGAASGSTGAGTTEPPPPPIGVGPVDLFPGGDDLEGEGSDPGGPDGPDPCDTCEGGSPENTTNQGGSNGGSGNSNNGGSGNIGGPPGEIADQ